MTFRGNGRKKGALAPHTFAGKKGGEGGRGKTNHSLRREGGGAALPEVSDALNQRKKKEPRDPPSPTRSLDRFCVSQEKKKGRDGAQEKKGKKAVVVKAQGIRLACKRKTTAKKKKKKKKKNEACTVAHDRVRGKRNKKKEKKKKKGAEGAKRGGFGQKGGKEKKKERKKKKKNLRRPSRE